MLSLLTTGRKEASLMLLGVNYSTGAVFNATPDGELRDIGHWFSSEPLLPLPELSLSRISLNKNVYEVGD